jgi:hypothetical protein
MRSPDEQFWSVKEGIKNSPGNLALHVLGNLNHFIGAKLGSSGYVRDRPAEFSSGAEPRAGILDSIDQTRSVVIGTISGLSGADLRANYPNDEGEVARTVAAELVRILAHLNYHLGQINYYRRLTTK